MLMVLQQVKESEESEREGRGESRGHRIGQWRRGRGRGVGGYKELKMKEEGFKFEKDSKAEGEMRQRGENG